MYTLSFLAFVSFVVALAATPLVRELFLRLGVVDFADGKRKLHIGAIPRVGGVALVLAYGGTFGLLLLTNLHGAETLAKDIDLVWKLAPAAGLVFFIGLMDDMIRVRAKVKFLVHVVAAMLAYTAGARVLNIGGRGFEEVWWSLPLTVFWLVLCTNAFNLIDGVDGLASGVGVFAALTAMAAGLMHGHYGLVMATAPLAGALLGFLRYNFSPASIFLGDSGSYVVGFLLGCFGLLWSQKAATLLGMTAPLMALAIPLMDTGLSVVRRFLSGRPLFCADRGHIHHKLLERGWPVRRAVLVLYAVCGMAAILSLVGSAWQGRMTGLALVVFVAGAWVGVQHLGYTELSTVGNLIRPRGFRRMIGAEMSLRAIKEGLARAESPADVWEVVSKGAKEFGFSSAIMFLDGVKYGGRWVVVRDEWRLLVPLADHGFLELGHGFESTAASPMADLLARVIKDGIDAYHRPAKSLQEFANSVSTAATAGD